MDTRNLSVPAPFPAPPAPPAEASTPVAGLPYDELLRIAQLFAGEHLHTDHPPPAPYQQMTPEVRQLLNERYMARVHDLVEREEGVLLRRGILASAQQYPELVAPARPEPKPAPAVPAFVWKYSAIALSTGGGIALAGVGVGAAAPTLALLDDILAAAGQIVMGLTALVVVLCLAFCGRPTQNGSGGSTVVNIGKAIIKRSRFHG
ncbi:hypothetical protein ABZ851_30185 [Streptomyces sp. NPDC047049]|uniref:hypothetical protein n=1 Tax=Streptomyces sp. NPDC047049 TaxID=3156688 RepID=UPI0033C561A1